MVQLWRCWTMIWWNCIALMEPNLLSGKSNWLGFEEVFKWWIDHNEDSIEQGLKKQSFIVGKTKWWFFHIVDALKTRGEQKVIGIDPTDWYRSSCTTIAIDRWSRCRRSERKGNPDAGAVRSPKLEIWNRYRPNRTDTCMYIVLHFSASLVLLIWVLCSSPKFSLFSLV